MAPTKPPKGPSQGQPSLPSSRSQVAKPRKKSTSKSAKRQKTAVPVVRRYPGGEAVFFEQEPYWGTDASCVMFLNSDCAGHIPDEAMLYLARILGTLVEKILDSCMSLNGPLFVVQLCHDKIQRLENFLQAAPEIPSTRYRFDGFTAPLAVTAERVEAFHVDNTSFENDMYEISDFSTPSSSDEETTIPRGKGEVAIPGSLPTLSDSVPIDIDLCTDHASVGSALQETGTSDKRTSFVSDFGTVQDPPGPSKRQLKRDAEKAAELSRTSALAAPPLAGQSASGCSEAPSTSTAGSSCTSALAEPILASQSAGMSGAAPPPAPRRPRVRYRAINFSEVNVEVPPPEPGQTVIIRPTTPDTKLRNVNPKTLSSELSSHGAFLAVRDIRDGGLAVDFPDDTDLTTILALTTLAGTPVSCSRPVISNTCSAVLSGVHPELTPEEIQADVQTSPPIRVIAVKRLARPGQESWSVKLTFDGTSIPERAFLYGRSRRLKLYVERPLQCLKCGRFGHAIRVCRSSLRCWHCGQGHETAGCPNQAAPRCPNCGGGHPANAVACPARGFQVKVCEVRAASRVPHKVARQAVTKAVKSYADAARTSNRSTQSVPITSSKSAQTTTKTTSPPAPRVPLFKPNVAHPRPPAPGGSVDLAVLEALFKGFVTILSAAAASGDVSAAIGQVSSLFLGQVPGVDPSLFSV